jgi:inhibitor of KinA sporulation pathway (predicted exonuclease)
MDQNKISQWLQDGVMTMRRYEQKVKENGITEDLLRERRALEDKRFYDVLFKGLELTKILF